MLNFSLAVLAPLVNYTKQKNITWQQMMSRMCELHSFGKGKDVQSWSQCRSNVEITYWTRKLNFLESG